MEDIVKIAKVPVTISIEKVLGLMECHEDSPVYDEMIRECKALQSKVLKIIRPEAIMAFTKINEVYEEELLPLNSSVLYLISTLGGAVSELSKNFFEKGEYVKGMITDIMADVCLFSMDKELQLIIKKECKKRGIGIEARYEAPTHIPMVAQRIGFEKTNAQKEIQMKITSGFMLDPVKSSCQVFKISEDSEIFNAKHDCSKCAQVACPMGKVLGVEIVVKNKNKVTMVTSKENEYLLETLERNNLCLNTPCGGKGTCGKCKIIVVEGHLEITKSDQEFFTKKQLEEGYRLACKAKPKEACSIIIEEMVSHDFEIVSDHQENTILDEQESMNAHGKGYAIAVDIGTTTVAMSLIDMLDAKVINTEVFMNPQRVYGADVIARIQASIEGGKDKLQEVIREAIKTGIEQLTIASGIEIGELKKIVIVGNTTMGHLLLGYNCQTLGSFPFTPVHIDYIETTGKELLQEEQFSHIEMVMLPGISAFVGADIVAGLYQCNFHKSEKISFLIDLGTNGEMAIGNKDYIITTSTAAGPAFEGGNITCGIASIKGAICNVSIDNEQIIVKTIGGKEPLGICGTGVIETVASLLENEWIDETGLLMDPYFSEDITMAWNEAGEKIIFTQKDIREVQLAKAAIRAGIETLLNRYGVTAKEIDKVFLAGGFGYKMNEKRAIAIGMLPEEWKDKIIASGNSALGGAIKHVIEKDGRKQIEQLKNCSIEINLSKDKEFNEYYMEHMIFC